MEVIKADKSFKARFLVLLIWYDLQDLREECMRKLYDILL